MSNKENDKETDRLLEQRFKVGDVVWFITSQSQKVLYGVIKSTAPNGCHSVRSGEYERAEFDDHLYATRELAEEHLKTILRQKKTQV